MKIAVTLPATLIIFPNASEIEQGDVFLGAEIRFDKTGEEPPYAFVEIESGVHARVSEGHAVLAVNISGREKKFLLSAEKAKDMFGVELAPAKEGAEKKEEQQEKPKKPKTKV